MNSAGNPTTWKTLTLLTDGTTNFRKSGQLLFDPPTDWMSAKRPAAPSGCYYVRVRTTAGNRRTRRS